MATKMEMTPAQVRDAMLRRKISSRELAVEARCSQKTIVKWMKNGLPQTVGKDDLLLWLNNIERRNLGGNQIDAFPDAKLTGEPV